MLFLPRSENLNEKFKNVFLDADKFEENLAKISENEDIYKISQFCLEIFYMNNFCGPFLPENLIKEYFSIPEDNFEEIEKICRNRLSIMGEVICKASKYNFLFLISTLVLKFEPKNETENLQHLIIYIIWSHLIDFPISTFRDKSLQNIQYLLSNLNKISNSDDRVTTLLICLQAFLIFKNYEKAEQLIINVSNILKIDVKLTGILGKRTKYQQRELPQMVLDIDLKDDVISEGSECLPEDVSLEDDTLLPKIQLSIDHKIPSLSSYHQCLLLMICYYKINRYPTHELTNEELLPFITAILETPQTYTLGRFALYYRSFFERDSNRKLERTLLQLENLVAEHLKFENEEVFITTHTRLSKWYLVIFLPFWGIKKLLAETFFKMGCVKSAIDQYLELKSFDELVSCYITLGRREKAQDLIDEEISKSGKNPHLLCLLGQINDDEKYYHEALELSGFKSFRAFYQLGYYHLNRKNLEKSIEYLEKALNINTIQPRTWYNIGCVYLETGLDEKAAIAFKTCCNIDPSNFKAWTNLASIFIRQKNLKSAYSAVLNAISCHFDSEKTWEMYAHISMLMEKPFDLKRCLDRLTDLSPTTNRDEIVEFLTIYIINMEKDRKIEELENKTIESILNWSKKASLTFTTWWMLAKLQIDNNSNIDKVIESYNCSIRAVIYSHKGIEKDALLLEQTVKMLEDLCEYLNKNTENVPRRLEFNNSTVKTIESLENRIKKFINSAPDQISDNFRKVITKLDLLRCRMAKN